MSATLSQLAEEARAAEVERDRDRRVSEREKQVDRVIEKFHDEWCGFGRLETAGLTVIECPEREEFTRRTEVLDWSSSRDERAYGWECEIDGIRWLFKTESESVSLRLLHTCPKCGAEGASDFHKLADIGALLRNGPKSYTHRCLERESRDVAYVIGSAARDTKLSPEEIVEIAFEKHSDLIYRLTTGR
jgi:hypothetical protein